MQKAIKGVTLLINGNQHEVSLEAAKQLYDELHELFGKSSYQYLPTPFEIPTHFPYKSPPIWSDCNYSVFSPPITSSKEENTNV